MSHRVELMTGEALKRGIPHLARLRIDVFREWPYLYDGNFDYEQWYLSKFADSPGAVIVAAYDGDEIIGASTAAPLAAQHEDFITPFRQQGIDPERVFYFGESVLKPAFRGAGLGVAFFVHREARARAHGGITHTGFCAVLRPDDHPLKPAQYVPLDEFWRRRGYQAVKGMTGPFHWKDIDQPGETEKTMQFWVKRIASPA